MHLFANVITFTHPRQPTVDLATFPRTPQSKYRGRRENARPESHNDAMECVLGNIHIHFQQIIWPLDWPDKKLGWVAQRWKSLKSSAAEWKERRERESELVMQWSRPSSSGPASVRLCTYKLIIYVAWSISQADTSDVIFDINCVCASTSTPRALGSVSIAHTAHTVYEPTQSNTLLLLATDKFSHSLLLFSHFIARRANDPSNSLRDRFGFIY